MGLRICTKCGGEFPATVKYFRKRYSGERKGLHTECKECGKKRDKLRYNNKKSRSWYYKRKYGITIKDYNKMFTEQEGKCWMCSKHPTEFNKKLSVDHNHDTGKVRGLLCQGCNTKAEVIFNYKKNPDKWDKYLKEGER